ncbi:MAG: hypothetical protein EBZ77_07945, partial [Chitinophagia bacterium]|nr:hypothetical protein [Chitinophagia bacterium]
MKKVTLGLTPEVVSALQIKDGDDDVVIAAAVKKAADAAQTNMQLASEMATLKTENEQLTQKVTAIEEAARKNEIKTILAGAMAAKKMGTKMAAQLEADYAHNPTGLKALVDALPAYQPITDKLEGGPAGTGDWKKFDG